MTYPIIQDSFNPTSGLQKRECPHCHKIVLYFIRQTWEDHIDFCKTKYGHSISHDKDVVVK